MKSLSRLILSYPLALGLVLGAVTVAASPDDEPVGIVLPDIGDPASELLSVNQEAELGKILLSQINRRLPVSTDPELRSYIQSLGTRLISGGLNSGFPFYFRMVFDPRINAFAMPGGIVVINSGLLLLSESESELASVVAHEISHVSQRHIARRFSRQKNFSVINTIAMLGTILATVYSSDAGRALATTTQGVLQSNELAYSRAYEREADRIGMLLLVNANLDPHGMPRFFGRLNNYSQINQGQIPEFLRSHPLTTSRITDSKVRADQFSTGRYVEDTIHYRYARARTQAISVDPNVLVQRYRELIELEPSNLRYYVYGIGLSRLGRGKQAIAALKRIKPGANEEFPVSIALAQAYISNGDIFEALEILEKLDQLYPANETVIFYLATALLQSDQAGLALAKLDTLTRDITGNPAIERLRAKAADGAGKPWRSHESLSNYDLMHAKYGTAMEHLLLAMRQTGIDEHSRERIKAKKEKLREFQKKYK